MAVFKTLQSTQAPTPIGIYSPATEYGGFIFFSGQLGLSASSQELAKGGCKAELIQIFHNLQAILAAKGISLSHIVKLTIYLKELADYPLVNETMVKFFTEPYPARAVVQVAGLPKQAAVEVEAIAVL